MALSFLDNVDYRGKKPNFTRDLFETKEDMKDYSENYLPDVFITTCKEDGKVYVFNRDNEVSEITGKWRKLEGGESSSTLEDDISVAFLVGGATEGMKFLSGDNIEDVLKTILSGRSLTDQSAYYGVANTKTTDLSGLTEVEPKSNFTITVSANNQYVVIACPVDMNVTIKSGGFDYTNSFTTAEQGDYKFFYSDAKVTCSNFDYTVTYY